MTMFLNLLYRTSRINNRTVLKRLSVTFLSEPGQIAISQKCYATLNTSDNLQLERLQSFFKLREFLIKTGKYKTALSRKLNIQEFFNPQVIQSMKHTNWFSLSSTESLKQFKLLSINAMQKNEQITDRDYMEIISVLTSKCWKYTDHELFILLRCLELWPNIHKIKERNNHVRKLLRRIDSELEKRSNFWAVEKTLMYCDTVCKFFNFHSEFVSKSLNRLTSNPSTLTSTDIVQIMYYLFIYALPKSQVKRLEPYIEDNFDKFVTEELGIICLGFFRQQVHISSDTFLCKIMQKIIDNVDSISDNDLGSCFKVIRYSFMSKLDCLKTCEKLLEVIVQRVPYMTDVVLTQLSHLVADSQIHNEALMTAIMERFSESIEIVRLKDIERMIFLMTTFNYPPSNPLYNLIIEELRSSHREEERKSFPREFGFALRHLALVNIYPVDLISCVMGREHMNLAYGPNPYNVEIEYLILDQSIRIEAPYYKGPRLDKNVCSILAKKYSVEAEHSFGSQSKRQIVHIIKNALNCHYAACLQRILPHFTQSDVVICLDENNNAVPVSSVLKNINSDIKRVPKEFRQNRKWIAIIFASETLLIRKTNQFNGNLCAKIRQLKKVGYVPIVVPYVEWRTLHSDSKKWEYLKKNIFENRNLQQKQEFVSEV